LTRPDIRCQTTLSYWHVQASPASAYYSQVPKVDSCQTALGQLQVAVELQNQLSPVDSLPTELCPWQTAAEFRYKLIQVDSLATEQGQLQAAVELQN